MNQMFIGFYNKITLTYLKKQSYNLPQNRVTSWKWILCIRDVLVRSDFGPGLDRCSDSVAGTLATADKRQREKLSECAQVETEAAAGK